MIFAPLVALSLAAVPPMSNEDRSQEAQLVVVGVVTRLEAKDVSVENGTDHAYTATIRVDQIEKGILPAPKSPPHGRRGTKKARSDSDTPLVITVRFRRTGTRPPGWTGPQGQMSLFEKGQRIRAFARTGADGQWHLLEPNGWEPAPTDTQAE